MLKCSCSVFQVGSSTLIIEFLSVSDQEAFVRLIVD